MKKNILLLVLFISGAMIAQTQESYPKGDPTGQTNTTQQSVRVGDFFIFGYSGGVVPENGLVLNGIFVPSVTQGWYLDDGQHSVSNDNYICGFYGGQYYRNFHAIDLSNLSSYGITPPITSVVMRTKKFGSLPSTGYAVWDLFSVSTPWPVINTSYGTGDPTGQAVFNDLGNGSAYGNGVVNGALPDNTIIETPMNSVGIADINNAIGGMFVFGGKSDNFLPDPPPTAITLAATNVTNTTATLHGTVNANGSLTTVTFCYGLTSGNLDLTIDAQPLMVSGSTTTAVMADLTGLIPGETYFFQTHAENNNSGIVSGLEMEFTLGGAQPPSVPLSDWAIYIAIMLIGIAIFYRFRTRIA